MERSEEQRLFGKGVFTFPDKKLVLFLKDNEPVTMGFSSKSLIMGPVNGSGLFDITKQSWLINSFTFKCTEKTDISLDKEVKQKYNQGLGVTFGIVKAYLFNLSKGGFSYGGVIDILNLKNQVSLDFLVQGMDTNLYGSIINSGLSFGLEGVWDFITLGAVSLGDTINPGYTIRGAGEYKNPQFELKIKGGITDRYYLDTRGDRAKHPYFLGTQLLLFKDNPFNLTLSYQQKGLSFEDNSFYYKGGIFMKSRLGALEIKNDSLLTFNSKAEELKGVIKGGVIYKGDMFSLGGGVQVTIPDSGDINMKLDINGAWKFETFEADIKNRFEIDDSGYMSSGSITLKSSRKGGLIYRFWAKIEYKTGPFELGSSLGIQIINTG